MSRLNLLREVCREVVIGPRVAAEVIEAGRVVRAPEVRLIESALEEGWIRKVQPTAREKKVDSADPEDQSSARG